MLDVSKIKAISLDLDDTLWPIWPTIERAEKALHDWLLEHAPATALVYSGAEARQRFRDLAMAQAPHMAHDLSLMRRESIRQAMVSAGDDAGLAEAAFEVFFAARQQVVLYDDALESLAFLAARFPLASLSNGNADLTRVGLDQYFQAEVSARAFGVAKPDPRIFHATSAALGVDSASVLHVGDDASLDVLGALGAGMQAAWVNRESHDWAHADQPHAHVSNLTQLCDRFR